MNKKIIKYLVIFILSILINFCVLKKILNLSIINITIVSIVICLITMIIDCLLNNKVMEFFQKQDPIQYAIDMKKLNEKKNLYQVPTAQDPHLNLKPCEIDTIKLYDKNPSLFDGSCNLDMGRKFWGIDKHEDHNISNPSPYPLQDHNVDNHKTSNDNHNHKRSNDNDNHKTSNDIDNHKTSNDIDNHKTDTTNEKNQKKHTISDNKNDNLKIASNKNICNYDLTNKMLSLKPNEIEKLEKTNKCLFVPHHYKDLYNKYRNPYNIMNWDNVVKNLHKPINLTKDKMNININTIDSLIHDLKENEKNENQYIKKIKTEINRIQENNTKDYENTQNTKKKLNSLITDINSLKKNVNITDSNKKNSNACSYVNLNNSYTPIDDFNYKILGT